MKKKILSTLLAVCLFVGVAIPSVFAYNSDLAGNAHRVTKITADAKSYDIKVGESTDFAEKISVFENGQRLVVDLNQIIFSATGDTNKFNINGSVVTAIETGGKITLAIYDDENKLARVEVTVNSTPGTAPDGNYATSFVYSKADRYDVVYDDGVLNKDTDFKFEVEAIPTGTKFSTTNAIAIADKVVAEMNAKLGLTDYINTPITGVEGSRTYGAFTVDMTNIITNLVDGNSVSIGAYSEVVVTAGVDGDYGNIAGVKDDMNTAAKAMVKIKRALLDKNSIPLTFVIEDVNYKYDAAKTATAGGNKLTFVQIGDHTNNVITEAGIAAAFRNDASIVTSKEVVTFTLPTATVVTDRVTIDGVTREYTDFATRTAGTFTVTITNAVGHATLPSIPTLTIAGQTITGDQVADAAVAADIGKAFNGKKVTIGGVTFTAAATVATIVFTADTNSTVTVPVAGATTTITANPTLGTAGTAPVTAPTNGIKGIGDTAESVAAEFVTKYNASAKSYDASSDSNGKVTLLSKSTGNKQNLSLNTSLIVTDFTIVDGTNPTGNTPMANILTKDEVSAVTQPSLNNSKLYQGVQVVKGGSGEETKIEFKVDRDELNFVTLAKTPGFNKNIATTVQHHMIRQDGNTGLNVTARTTLYPVKAIPITSVGFANSATMKVGEFKTFTVSKYPTNANVGFAGGIKYSTVSRKDVNSNDKYQHAIIWTEDGFKNEGFDVKVRAINSEKIGVSTGKVDAAVVLRAAVTTTNKDGVTSVNNHDATITVIDQDWKDEAVNTPEISTKNATIKVGGQVVLSVKNAPIGSTVKWSIDNANVSVDPATGLATTVRGKKVGNTVVTATMTNPNTSKTETYTCNVTVLAADVTKPGTTPPPPVVTPPSTNPPTGDTLFANIG